MNKKHVTSLELSKQLHEAGIKAESEFYWGISKFEKDEPEITMYRSQDEFDENEFKKLSGVWSFRDIEIGSYKKVYPAYLASELMEMLPDRTDKGWLTVEKVGLFEIGYVYKSELTTNSVEDKSLPNALGKMMLFLKKENLI